MEGADRWTYQLSQGRSSSIRKDTFAFASTDDDNDEWLHALIRSVWIRPDPPTAPPVLYTCISKGFRHQLVLMSDRGVTVIDGTDVLVNPIEKRLRKTKVDLQTGQLSAFFEIEKEWSDSLLPWAQVQAVEVWQLEHDRHDFVRMTMKLPDDEIEWNAREPSNKNRPNFRGAEARCQMSMIRKYVPANRLTISAENGPPLSMAEWQRRVDRIVEKQRADVRSWRKALIWGPAFMSILCLLGGWPQAIAVTILYGPIVYGISFGQQRRLQKLIWQYGSWQAELTPHEDGEIDRWDDAA